ncbi:MAG: hypothetical protein SNH18_07585 [Rikenellaceae bacterium]
MNSSLLYLFGLWSSNSSLLSQPTTSLHQNSYMVIVFRTQDSRQG